MEIMAGRVHEGLNASGGLFVNTLYIIQALMLFA